ncbi:MAG TPA: HAD family phosphatase [Syntrophorhabdales bacterium]|nr:HAD family phosphatase [Syntrophorhabdales bacterium]
MIELFVFDLGKVILPFEHRQIASKLWQRCRNKGRLPESAIFDDLFDMENGAINRYEEGLSSSEEFFLDIRKRYDLAVEFEEFSEIWNNIFWDNPEVDKVLVYLKSKGYPLFLLSNTNELHFSYVIERFPIVHLFDEWILSFEVGAKKPAKRMYDAIFEKTDVDRAHVLYIDDIDAYVQAARSYGIPGLVYTSPEDLWHVLRQYGI